MIAARARGRRPWAMAAPVALLALSALYAQSIGGVGDAAPAADAAAMLPPPVEPAAGEPGPPTAVSVDAILARPLFSPTRRPGERSTASPRRGPVSKNRDDLLFAGVIISDTGRVALVQDGRTNAYYRLTQGQSVLGWSVEAIFPDRIVLRNGLRGLVLRQADRRPPPPSALAQGAPRPPSQAAGATPSR